MQQLLQVSAEDHVTPFLNGLGAMHLCFRDIDEQVPPMPNEAVSVEHGVGPGGAWLKIMPTAELMAWAALIRSRASAPMPYRRPAHLTD